jgi:hypothetical protein
MSHNKKSKHSGQLHVSKHRRNKPKLYALHFHELSITQKLHRENAYKVLAMMRNGSSFSAGCIAAKIDPRTARKHISKAMYKRNNRYKPRKNDHLFRNMRTNEFGKDIFVELSNFKEASKLAHYHRAVRDYLQNGDIGQLNSYKGEGVIDSDNIFHPFEVNPKEIIKIHERIEQPEFYSIYEV